LLVNCSSSWQAIRLDGAFRVHKHFAKWPLRRRFVALAAAYAIALSSIIANFGVGRAAVAEFGAPGTVTCHTEIAGDPTPAGSQDDGKTCADSCCIGCLMLTAALPPPPVKVAGAPQATRQILPPPAADSFTSRPQTKSHQSRAPPFGV
jgi:hypothetical protein